MAHTHIYSHNACPQHKSTYTRTSAFSFTVAMALWSVPAASPNIAILTLPATRRDTHACVHMNVNTMFPMYKFRVGQNLICTRCIHGILSREITIHTVVHGVYIYTVYIYLYIRYIYLYIRSWLTLCTLHAFFEQPSSRANQALLVEVHIGWGTYSKSDIYLNIVKVHIGWGTYSKSNLHLSIVEVHIGWGTYSKSNLYLNISEVHIGWGTYLKSNIYLNIVEVHIGWGT
jgi:hypothetical protein